MGVDGVVIATSALAADDPIAELSEQRGWLLHRGSESDVLDRYRNAAAENEADHIVRVTADCPLVCPRQGRATIAHHLLHSVDLTQNLTVFGSGMPLGTGVEVVSRDALERSWRDGQEPKHREHVLEFAYEHPEVFRVELVAAPDGLRRPDYRLTVDVQEDLELVRKIYRLVAAPRELSEVVATLDEQPELARINAHVAQRTV
jgi:spore coat polysaccharide biosynthesis protein SpsF